MEQYVVFVKVELEQRQQVINILKRQNISHPRMLKSKTITPEKMSGWGLSDGHVTRLYNNVSKFDKSCRAQRN